LYARLNDPSAASGTTVATARLKPISGRAAARRTRQAKSA